MALATEQKLVLLALLTAEHAETMMTTMMTMGLVGLVQTGESVMLMDFNIELVVPPLLLAVQPKTCPRSLRLVHLLVLKVGLAHRGVFA
jgi:hypothetical protein